jgi:hypothetical protein
MLRHVMRLVHAPDSEVMRATVTLQEVQHALAQEYGFKSWKELKDHVGERTALAVQADAAMSVFVSKGPTHDSTGSEWSKTWHAEIGRLRKSGETGFRVMEELSRSPNGRARSAAVLFFWLSGDPRSTAHLRRLLSDESVAIRCGALRGYAAHIHPARRDGRHWGVSVPAAAVPEGIDAILPMVGDGNIKVRMYAVKALSDYADLHDDRVDGALRKALDDPKHKVRHAAARALGIACPGCGKPPESASEVE